MLRRTAAVALGVAVGVAGGVGTYTFVYAKGWSYLTDDPSACANCHVMEGHFRAWSRGPHRTAATCNDCHVPEALVPRYVAKAEHGFWHSYGFTTGRFHEPIRAKPRSAATVEERCRDCHGALVHSIDPLPGVDPVACVRCHRSAGHDT